MTKYENEITAYALKNAIEFGKADAGRILPKLFQHGLQKSEIKEIMPIVSKQVQMVNKLSLSEREGMFKQFSSYVKEKEEEGERELPELENAGKNMTFRLAPYPSGALHIGNAKTYLLNALYAEKYGAKTLLVMDDTIGSEEKQIAPEAYNLLQDAFDWLSVKYEKPIFYKSDRIKIYYDYAEQLIRRNKAYVCHCSQEELRENRAKGVECSCRQFPSDIQIKRWEEMFNMKEGEAVLRIKTNMMHPNPAFRDRVLFKISDREHPRVGKKYRVWPTLEMSWAIDDHVLGITHILRGNDLMIETDMEKYIWDIFGWTHPVTIHTGMVRIEGMGAKISKSKAQKEVRSGEFIGWDDPRTWSIQSLSRRGIKPETIREFVKEIGLNRSDIIVPIDALYSINRKSIDADTPRFSFVKEPIKLDILNKPEIEIVDIPVHPDKKETREIRIGEIYISKDDFEGLKGKEGRLLHLYNLIIDDKSKFTSIDNKDIQRIQWVSSHVKARILMPDGNWIEGGAESDVTKLDVGSMVQFERFGFCRFDKVSEVDGEKVYEFWFGHK